LTNVIFPAVGVGGIGLITTLIVAAGDEQLPADCVTLIIYVPALVGIIQFVLDEDAPKPALGLLADQLKVAPLTPETLKFTVTPKQAGFGMAVKLVGAAGALGSERTTGPPNKLEGHPAALVILKFEYEPATSPVKVATPDAFEVILTVNGVEPALYCNVYVVLLASPDILICPLLPPQIVGFTPVTFVLPKAGGLLFTTTVICAASDVQPATV
jgi:hypothetical protein